MDRVQQRALVLAEPMEYVTGSGARIVATFGGIGSRAIRELKYQILGEYQIPDVTEASARGAALFGGMATRIINGPREFPPPISVSATPKADPPRRD